MAVSKQAQADAIMRGVERERKKFVTAIARAAKQEYTLEMRESQHKTPIEYGRLIMSHRIEDPVIDTETSQGEVAIMVRITVGGTVEDGQLVDYAWYVHENLEAHHDRGEAKFLESTLNESAPYMTQRIANRYRTNGGR